MVRKINIMKKFYIILLGILLFFGINSNSKAYSKYIWPIKSKQVLTGSFGEYRSVRFHLGVDLSSGGVNGRKVIASNSGYVSKIIYQKWGIGYAVFIKHKNGETTMYGHLSRFAKKILHNKKVTKIKDLIADKKDFKILFSPNEIKVLQGQTIAFSGDTGIGPTHLHFELRDKNNKCLNPLTNGLFNRDRFAPIINSLAIVPIKNNISMDRYEKFYTPIKKKNRYYITPDKIKIPYNKFYLKIDTFDRSGYNRVGILGIRVYANNKLLYDFFFNKIKRDDRYRMGLYYDYTYSNYKNFIYFLYNRKNYKGVIDLNKFKKNIKIKIVVYDHSFNKRILYLWVKKDSLQKEEMPTYKANLIAGKKLKLKSSKFQITFFKNSAFYNERIVLESESPFFSFVRGISIKSKIYTITPENLTVNDPPEIRIKYSGSDYKKIGIYIQPHNKPYYMYLKNSYNKNDNYFFANIRKTGKFFLARDDSPPSRQFISNKHLIRKRIIKFKLMDTGSGIDLKKVFFKVDGRNIKWDYDIDKRTIYILRYNRHNRFIWKRGKHSIKIQLTDRAENKSSLYNFNYFRK